MTHAAGPAFEWMVKALMPTDPFDTRVAGLLNSAVQIEMAQRIMS
jgi:hypothetical protein